MKHIKEARMIGILGNNIQYHDTKTGGKGVTFSIGVTRYWKSKVDPTKWENETEWFDLVSWAPEVVRILLQSQPGNGQDIEVKGSFNINKWTDKHGHERTTLRVIVSSLEIIEVKKEMAEYVGRG